LHQKRIGQPATWVVNGLLARRIYLAIDPAAVVQNHFNQGGDPRRNRGYNHKKMEIISMGLLPLLASLCWGLNQG
jgi:hypothetical protein